MNKKGKNTKQEAVVEFLPEEIVIEILVRLPMKSLLRFKTTWPSIINCPEFITKHLNLTRAARYNQHKNFLGLLIPDEYESYPWVLYKEDSDGILHAKEFDFPFKSFVGHEKEIFFNACNSYDGLICFVSSKDHRILIWNPSLPTEYKIIESQSTLDFDIVAMGYDPTSDDYKIIKVNFESSIDECCILVEIFSLKSNSWKIKRITRRKPIYFFTSMLIYAKNGIHWIAAQCYEEGEEEAEHTECLMYFNLAEESLDYMNFPSKSLIHPVVMNYKESIAIAGFFEEQHELWVLKDYCRMKSSWNKIFSSKFIVPLFSCYFSLTLNGEILVLTEEGRLIILHLQDGSFKHVVVQGDKITYNEKCYYSCFVSPYVESLVSPLQLQ